MLNHEIDFSAVNSQDSAPTAILSSFSSFTSSQEPSLSSQSSTMTSGDAIRCENASHSSKDECASMADDSSEAPNLPLGNSIQQPTGICQTFKVDSKGNMRPRDPGQAFESMPLSKSYLGYLANRRNAPFIVHDEIDHLSTVPGSVDQNACRSSSGGHGSSELAKSLRKSSSTMKLLTDADGNAEVTARTGDTPSPPHPESVLFQLSSRTPRLGLHRSFSAVDRSTYHKAQDNALGSFPCRPPAGRSRDTRTWEFYCDSDARDALTKQAEREESGSATAVIGLIRSHSSNNKTLTPNSNKRNAHVQKHDSIKRHKLDKEKSSKPKLGRTTSSVARLQTTAVGHQNQKAIKQATKHGKSNSQSAIFEDFDADSDKENWVPGTQTRRPPRRRPVTSQESARILLESLREPSETSSLKIMLGSQSTNSKLKPSVVDDKENGGPEFDDEAAAFMAQESLPRGEEDLDCVQNLLRLSQAAWN